MKTIFSIAALFAVASAGAAPGAVNVTAAYVQFINTMGTTWNAGYKLRKDSATTTAEIAGYNPVTLLVNETSKMLKVDPSIITSSATDPYRYPYMIADVTTLETALATKEDKQSDLDDAGELLYLFGYKDATGAVKMYTWSTSFDSQTPTPATQCKYRLFNYIPGANSNVRITTSDGTGTSTENANYPGDSNSWNRVDPNATQTYALTLQLASGGAYTSILNGTWNCEAGHTYYFAVRDTGAAGAPAYSVMILDTKFNSTQVGTLNTVSFSLAAAASLAGASLSVCVLLCCCCVIGIGGGVAAVVYFLFIKKKDSPAAPGGYNGLAQPFSDSKQQPPPV